MTPAEIIIERVMQELPNNWLPTSHAGVPPNVLARVPQYGTKVGEFLTVGIDHLASPDTGEVFLMPPIVALFNETRRNFGEAIPVTAGSRTHEHETALQGAGYKAAKICSPHCLGAALDLDARDRTICGRFTSETAVNILIQQAAREAADKLGFPTPRLGHLAYNERFTHMDLVFMLFAPHTKLPHPADWPELPQDVRKKIGASWRPGVNW